MPPDFPLSDNERFVLAKGLKFVPNPGSVDSFSVKEDTEKFFRHLRLKAHFFNSNSVQVKNVFETLNPKKSSWSLPEGQFGSLEIFIQQCRHEINKLPSFKPKRPSNLSEAKFSALKSLQQIKDIVIKPADKGDPMVVWRADLYCEEAQKQLSDTTFYHRVDSDLTSNHNTIIWSTINQLIHTGELPETACNLLVNTPRTPVMYFLTKIYGQKFCFT